MSALIDMASSCPDSRLVFQPGVKKAVKRRPGRDSRKVMEALTDYEV